MVHNSINGSAFVMIDDDAAGSSAPAVNASLTSPIINAMGYDTLTVEFDHYFYQATRERKGYVEVYDGSSLGEDRLHDHHTWILDRSRSRNV